jgi:hypothetical protein
MPTYPSGTVVVMRRVCLSGLLAAVVVAPALYGCGSNAPMLNTVTVRRAIAESILTQHHLYATVSCPSRIPRKAGFAFTCTANLNVGTYPVMVTETNGSGHVRYENQARWSPSTSRESSGRSGVDSQSEGPARHRGLPRREVIQRSESFHLHGDGQRPAVPVPR